MAEAKPPRPRVAFFIAFDLDIQHAVQGESRFCSSTGSLSQLSLCSDEAGCGSTIERCRRGWHLGRLFAFLGSAVIVRDVEIMTKLSLRIAPAGVIPVYKVS